jgi:Ser/Thr protein kinase RdoA (MazF antagonist)
VITHQISTDRERQVVAKRYLGARQGEAAREWRALQLLAEHAPRLAPEPISADLDADPPLVVMSLLPGEPLGGGPLSAEQERALAIALGRLWQSVPVGLVAPLPGELDVQANLVRLVHEQAVGAGPGLDADPVVQEALVSSVTWLARAAGLTSAGGQGGTGMPRVLGQGDANLANFLWDGELVRIVDFEDSGVSDRAFELAVLVEHISAWWDAGLDGDQFIEGFDLTVTERGLLADWRRLAALYWLLRLRPAGDGAPPGPPGLLRRQAERLLAQL